MKPSFLLTALIAVPVALQAQAATPAPAGVAAAAASITAADVRTRIFLLADDSMRGRDTPSPELEKAAQYIAGEFHRFGLRPGGDNGTFIQRYAISRARVDTAASTLVVEGARRGALHIGREIAVLPFLDLPQRDLSGPVLVVGGPAAADSNRFAGAEVKGAWIVVAATMNPQAPGGITADWSTVQAAVMSGAHGIILISERSDSAFARALARTARPSMSITGGRRGGVEAALLELRDADARALLGVDAAALRRATTRTVEPLAGVTLAMRPRFQTINRIEAPNVVGILEGSDPALKNEYVVFSAHMDHVGVAADGRCRAQGADSICNGADDDASGTVAVVELAEAFSRLHPRPKRSTIFLTVSGEERGLWGSRFFAENPPVPMSQIVADLNMDMVGRNWPDTIAVIGREHSDLGSTLDRVAAAHPELNMTPINDIWPQENFYRRSDHFNFAVKGVPILFFFNGTHPDYHQVGDSPDKIDTDKEARIARLVFYLGYEIATAPQKPQWKPESYREIVQSAERQ